MIIYIDSAIGLTPDRFQGFFVGWPDAPSPETHLKLFRGSDHIVMAIDQETTNVVGFVTAITDGVLSAFIPFLEVLSDYQGQGIGEELLRRMLDQLDGLYAVDLICDLGLQPFYAQFGMKPATGMSMRRYKHQSGIPSAP